jgi:hypothetical protein
MDTLYKLNSHTIVENLGSIKELRTDSIHTSMDGMIEIQLVSNSYYVVSGVVH